MAARELASFDWTDLGAFPEDRRVAQVWLALKRSHTATVAPIPLRADTPFAVTVTTIAAHYQRAAPGPEDENVLDGVIAAFQAHTGGVTQQPWQRRHHQQELRVARHRHDNRMTPGDLAVSDVCRSRRDV